MCEEFYNSKFIDTCVVEYLDRKGLRNLEYRLYEATEEAIRLTDHLNFVDNQLVIPFQPFSETEVMASVKEELIKNGFNNPCHISGTVVDKHGRQVKLGRVLKRLVNEQLYNSYNEDVKGLKAELKKSDLSDYEILISRRVIDVITMSTLRPWRSCMTLGYGDEDEGVNWEYVFKDVLSGTHIAYLVKKGDRTTKTAISRILLKPRLDLNSGLGILWPETKIYGSKQSLMLNAVKNWCEISFPNLYVENTIFDVPGDLYEDSIPNIPIHYTSPELFEKYPTVNWWSEYYNLIWDSTNTELVKPLLKHYVNGYSYSSYSALHKFKSVLNYEYLFSYLNISEMTTVLEEVPCIILNLAQEKSTVLQDIVDRVENGDNNLLLPVKLLKYLPASTYAKAVVKQFGSNNHFQVSYGYTRDLVDFIFANKTLSNLKEIYDITNYSIVINLLDMTDVDDIILNPIRIGLLRNLVTTKTPIEYFGESNYSVQWHLSNIIRKCLTHNFSEDHKVELLNILGENGWVTEEDFLNLYDCSILRENNVITESFLNRINKPIYDAIYESYLHNVEAFKISRCVRASYYLEELHKRIPVDDRTQETEVSRYFYNIG